MAVVAPDGRKAMRSTVVDIVVFDTATHASIAYAKETAVPVEWQPHLESDLTLRPSGCCEGNLTNIGANDLRSGAASRMVVGKGKVGAGRNVSGFVDCDIWQIQLMGKAVTI